MMKLFSVIKVELNNDYDIIILDNFDSCVDATKFVRDYVINQFYDGDIKNTPKNFDNCFYLGNYYDGEVKIAVVYNEVR